MKGKRMYYAWNDLSLVYFISKKKNAYWYSIMNISSVRTSHERLWGETLRPIVSKPCKGTWSVAHNLTGKVLSFSANTVVYHFHDSSYQGKGCSSRLRVKTEMGKMYKDWPSKYFFLQRCSNEKKKKKVGVCSLSLVNPCPATFSPPSNPNYL